MVFVGTATPVAFFAYPDRPSVLVPEGCATMTLAQRSRTRWPVWPALADALGAPSQRPLGNRFKVADGAAERHADPARPAGQSVARHMPEGAIICDDAVTSGGGIAVPCATAQPHEVLALTGGAIGIGAPADRGGGRRAGPQGALAQRRRLGDVHASRACGRWPARSRM